MDNVKMKVKLVPVLYVVAVFCCSFGNSVDPSVPSTTTAPPPPPPAVPQPAPNAAANVTYAVEVNHAVNVTQAVNVTSDSNRTTNDTKPVAVAAVTQVPLLGENGTGIRHDPDNKTPPLVSEPIKDDDENFTDQDVINETPEKVKAQMNLQNLTFDNHSFYNSTFIGNAEYFDQHWANITKQKPEVHVVLSHSYRRATNQKLSFVFPFYGYSLHNVTVATGGFIYTGEHVHHWLAATQYIAPLMANFDTTLTNDSYLNYYDDGEKFTVIWEKVALQEDPTKPFTFAVTLYKNGDIVFAYKDIPIKITSISDVEHPVKVGISDAYLTDKLVMFVRRKTIYEYHRVSFKKHDIGNKTLLKLTALPTCLTYTSCDACANHQTGFNCAWCESIRKCSSGTDRNKQDWTIRSCDKTAVSNASQCPARAPVDSNGTVYSTDEGAHPHTDFVTTSEAPATNASRSAPAPSAAAPVSAPAPAPAPAPSTAGGVAALLLALAAVCCLAGWMLYAFKNPHTRSGQLLIKYRPSQWSWRRGEARYTAATIHM